MKNNTQNSSRKKFSKLRQRAEEMLNADRPDDRMLLEKDMKSLFQELQVHQIELEMQNDELEMQRLKLAGLFNLAPVGYFILNNLGDIIEANPAGVELLNGNKAWVINQHLQKFIAPADRDKFIAYFRHLPASGVKEVCQLRLLVKNEHQVYALLAGIYVKSLSQYYVTITDISESIAARKTIAETKERLELAMEASSAGTWTLDMHTLRFEFDEFFYHLCQQSKGNFDGSYNSFIKIIHPDDRIEADQHFRMAINHGSKIHLTCRLIAKENKACYVSIKGHRISNTSSENAFIGILWDITEKRLHEQAELKQKEAQQKEIAAAVLLAQENERKRISESLHDSLGQLLYGIKLQLNELNIPNTNTAFIHLEELLTMAVRETRNISFELAPCILTDFGLKVAVEELCERLATPSLNFNVLAGDFKTRFHNDLEINAFRIVQELINNSIKHSKATEITVKLKKSKQLEIVVSDNGLGFDVKEQHNKPKGMGLNSIKNRLNVYGGHMYVTSVIGKGTSTRVTLTC